MTSPSTPQPLDWLASERIAPFLNEAHSDPESALELYVWAARVSSACFATVGHLEVLLRHSIDRTLAEMFDEDHVGIPWFLRRSVMPSGHEGLIVNVRDRLGSHESRDQIVANLSFGFWAGMLSKRHDELWKQGLHRAFPSGPGLRKDIAVHVDAIRRFRNRLAHHDSILKVDIPFEMERVFRVARMLAPEVETWLRDIDDSLSTYSSRPVTTIDTLIVPGVSTYETYQHMNSYICEAGRRFRAVERIGFYTNGQVNEHVPQIVGRRDDVAWTEENAEHLSLSENREDRKIGTVISESRRRGMPSGRYQVFLLTAPDDPRTRHLLQPITHHRRGRGSAFVRRYRYLSMHALETAQTTEDLMS